MIQDIFTVPITLKAFADKFDSVAAYTSNTSVQWGEEGQPQQFLVRAPFSSFSRPSHTKILVL